MVKWLGGEDTCGATIALDTSKRALYTLSSLDSQGKGANKCSLSMLGRQHEAREKRRRDTSLGQARSSRTSDSWSDSWWRSQGPSFTNSASASSRNIHAESIETPKKTGTNWPKNNGRPDSLQRSRFQGFGGRLDDRCRQRHAVSLGGRRCRLDGQGLKTVLDVVEGKAVTLSRMAMPQRRALACMIRKLASRSRLLQALGDDDTKSRSRARDRRDECC